MGGILAFNVSLEYPVLRNDTNFASYPAVSDHSMNPHGASCLDARFSIVALAMQFAHESED